jgi:hypothetical protein
MSPVKDYFDPKNSGPAGANEGAEKSWFPENLGLATTAGAKESA